MTVAGQGQTGSDALDARALTERLFAAADRSTEPVIAVADGIGAFDVVGAFSTPRGPVLILKPHASADRLDK